VPRLLAEPEQRTAHQHSAQLVRNHLQILVAVKSATRCLRKKIREINLGKKSAKYRFVWSKRGTFGDNRWI
jgi:hypothetical protein